MSDTAAVPVTPLLPECVAGRLTTGDFVGTEAVAFQPDSAEYYKDVLPSVIPGLVLGGLAFICFLFFLCWILVQYCVCCCGCGRGNEDDPELSAQFIKKNSTRTTAATAFGYEQSKKSRGCTRFVQICIIVSALATIGACAYGIYASIEQTDDQIPGFWEVVDNVDNKVENTTEIMSRLSTQLTELEQSIAVLEQNSVASLQQAAQSIPVVGAQVSAGLGALGGLEEAIKETKEQLDQGQESINKYLGSAIDNFTLNYKAPTESFQYTGRYVAFAVLFGLTILATLFAALLSLQVRSPIWASAFVALLWFMVTLLMLAGAGVMKGVGELSDDACLYAETFVLQASKTRIQDPVKQQYVVRALEFYLMPPNGNETFGTAAQEVTGVDFLSAYNALNSPEIATLASVLESDAGAALVSVAGGSAETSQAVQKVASLLEPIRGEVTQLVSQAERDNVVPIQENVKSIICCDIASPSNSLFIAWTISGSIGFLTALLCSVRIVRYTFDQKAER